MDAKSVSRLYIQQQTGCSKKVVNDLLREATANGYISPVNSPERSANRYAMVDANKIIGLLNIQKSSYTPIMIASELGMNVSGLSQTYINPMILSGEIMPLKKPYQDPTKRSKQFFSQEDHDKIVKAVEIRKSPFTSDYVAEKKGIAGASARELIKYAVDNGYITPLVEKGTKEKVKYILKEEDAETLIVDGFDFQRVGKKEFYSTKVSLKTITSKLGIDAEAAKHQLRQDEKNGFVKKQVHYTDLGLKNAPWFVSRSDFKKLLARKDFYEPLLNLTEVSRGLGVPRYTTQSRCLIAQKRGFITKQVFSGDESAQRKDWHITKEDFLRLANNDFDIRRGRPKKKFDYVSERIKSKNVSLTSNSEKICVVWNSINSGNYESFTELQLLAGKIFHELGRSYLNFLDSMERETLLSTSVFEAAVRRPVKSIDEMLFFVEQEILKIRKDERLT